MLLCLPTELWKNIAQMDAVAAIRLRTANKRLKAEIESRLCEWIYQRFVPNIVGLPWDLKPKYYVRLLCNYFCTDLHPFFVKEAVRDTVARLQKNVEYFSNKTNGVYWISAEGGRGVTSKGVASTSLVLRRCCPLYL